jgi:diacylglycerol kinase (ATP)
LDPNGTISEAAIRFVSRGEDRFMTDGNERRCAVIFNPIKISDGFQEAMASRVAAARWADPVWLPTAEHDPGRSMAATAVKEQFDLVVAAGGDGTVRVVADGLANSGIPMGIVPSGTANLLARNLGIPLAEDDAIDVVLSGRNRTIDLIKLSIDGREPEHYAVMAGMGIDAMTMDEARPELKEKIGTAAYFVAAARALGRLPVPMTIRVDNHRPRRRHAMICVVGNVGELPGNITLIPGAEPDDGRLDVYVASPHRLNQWIRVFARLITRRSNGEDRVDQWRGRRVEVRLNEPDNYQLDGDVVGELRRLLAEIQPQALSVRVPA